MKIAVLAVLVVLVAAVPASAETIHLVPTCVESTEPERGLLVRALEKLELLIVASGCTETITLEHQRDGETLTVWLASPRVRVKRTVNANADLLDVYTGMASSLEQPVEAAEPTAMLEDTPPTTVPSPHVYEAPPSDDDIDDSVWFARLGFGSYTGIIAGHRWGAGRSVLETSLVASSELVSIRLQLLKVSNPKSHTSFYWGGGVALGVAESEMETDGGMLGEATIGFEIGRTTSSRVFMELNGSVPAFDYPATAVFAFGIGK